MQLVADRRTVDAFRVRRAQIILASARRLSPKPIAQLVGCSVQTVRNVIRAFNRQGVEGLVRHSNRPKSVAPILNAVNCERLQHILHQSPRTYGQARGTLWGNRDTPLARNQTRRTPHCPTRAADDVVMVVS